MTSCPPALDALLAGALERSLGFDRASVGTTLWHLSLKQRAQALALDAETYCQRAAGDPVEQQRLLEALNIDESWVERDPAQWQAIRTELLARDPTRPLHALCAPCARGEEAWTLAALLHGLGHRAPQARVWAVDVNPQAIARGRSGTLPAPAWRGPADAVPWWLLPGRTATDSPWRVDVALHPLVRFEHANLFTWQPPEAVAFDLILSRNFLIYLSPAAQHAWRARLRGLAALGATLWTAPSERLDGDAPALFRTLDTAGGWQAVPVDAAAGLPASPVATAGCAPRPADHRLQRTRPPEPSCAVAPAPAPAGAVVAITPADPAGAGELARALIALSRDELTCAEALLRQALYLDHDCEEALLHLAALRARLGDPEEARRLQSRLRRPRQTPA